MHCNAVNAFYYDEQMTKANQAQMLLVNAPIN